ncbi:hypothetical protein Nepgr_003883 [Nepenthes gracilis]|uniref:Uncharacterized protein n=1 Tax=Nepenthes gracilis TaxID=150966 RepID=A0AAD3S0G5_NEPGR|nr:hypothetical protein Nepgr_003883 [Nepenthes gracilis]
MFPAVSPTPETHESRHDHMLRSEQFAVRERVQQHSIEMSKMPAEVNLRVVVPSLFSNSDISSGVFPPLAHFPVEAAGEQKLQSRKKQHDVSQPSSPAVAVRFSNSVLNGPHDNMLKSAELHRSVQAGHSPNFGI